MKFFSLQTRSTTSYSNPNQWTMGLRAKIPQQVITPPPQIAVPTPSPVGKVKWGPAVWYLLHTISVKVKESDFSYIRVDLLNHIYAICTNLPCPDCSNHAKAYLDGVNFNTIQTKTDLIKLLWAFHNTVNQRKGYPFYQYDQIDETYSKAVTNNIIIHFMAHFSDRNRSLKLLPTDLHRMRLCQALKIWFNDHITSFDP
jgi:hypothetical protein